MKYKFSFVPYIILLNVIMSIPPIGWFPINIFTYSFIHLNIWHLLVNMIGIFFWGMVLERHWGRRKFIEYYLLMAIGAGAFQQLLQPGVSAIGASGVVFGLMTGYAVLFPTRKIRLFYIPIRADVLLILLVLAEIILQVLGLLPDVSHWTHVGGAVSAGLAMTLTKRWNCEKQL